VVDLATARIFAAQTVDGRSVLENTSYDGYPEYPSRYDARDAALRQGVTQVHRMFFAWDERRQLYFFNDDECNLRAAFKLLQIDDVEGAAEVSAENLEVCKTADVKPKFFARAYYNLGMTRLLQSRYDEALGHLEQAYRLDGGSIIAESISETRRAKDLAAAMARVEDSAAVGPAIAQTSPEPAAGGGDGSVAARLQQLDSLLAQGLISDDEYEQKRKEILSEI
jgi:tetratricopeptide (TPR) repeat protein